MENQKSKRPVELIAALVACVLVIVLMLTKASEIKKENTTLRQGSVSSAAK